VPNSRTNTFDVVIIGGGLHGLSAALHLARRGLKPGILEKNWSGRHASGVNAGGVRTLLRDPAEIPLALEARKLWHAIADLVDEDCSYKTVGQVAVAETPEEMDRLKARHGVVRQLGHQHEVLVDRAELREMVPALADYCLGGLAALGDGLASPYHTTRAFKRKAVALGARLFEGTRAERIERVGEVWRVTSGTGVFEAPVLINCGGAWAGQCAAMLGDEAPIETILPMMMVTERLPRFVEPVVIASGRPLSLKQMANGTVVMGGGYLATGDLASEGNRIEFAGLKKSAATIAELFPALRNARIMRCWAGFEGRMPDDIPVIGPSAAAPQAFHAFGFSGHGFQLSPIVGRILADLVTEGASELPIEPFSIRRFANPR
jgi:sarcosine oxidase subunit beta